MRLSIADKFLCFLSLVTFGGNNNYITFFTLDTVFPHGAELMLTEYDYWQIVQNSQSTWLADMPKLSKNEFLFYLFLFRK